MPSSLMFRYFLEPLAKKVEQLTVEQPQMAVLAHKVAWAEFELRRKALKLLYGQRLETAPKPFDTEAVKGALAFGISTSVVITVRSAYKWHENLNRAREEEQKLAAVNKEMEEKVDVKLSLLKAEVQEDFKTYLLKSLQNTEIPKEP